MRQWKRREESPPPPTPVICERGRFQRVCRKGGLKDIDSKGVVERAFLGVAKEYAR